MQNNKISVRRGATEPMTWTNDEEGATTATITISKDGIIVKQKTVNFVGLVADLTLTDQDTDIEVGEYKYMITLVYDDGTVEKYPDTNNWGCELPIFEVCEANDEETS